MDKQKLLEVFKEKLPALLGVPYFVNTAEKPYVFAAFYDAKRHELTDGRIINGNEFRLWEASTGFKQPSPLAGIIGVDEINAAFVICGLADQGTRSRDIKPYSRMIREMMAHIVTKSINQ